MKSKKYLRSTTPQNFWWLNVVSGNEVSFLWNPIYKIIGMNHSLSLGLMLRSSNQYMSLTAATWKKLSWFYQTGFYWHRKCFVLYNEKFWKYFARYHGFKGRISIKNMIWSVNFQFTRFVPITIYLDGQWNPR